MGPYFFTDASLSGYGYYCDGDWQAGFLKDIIPEMSQDIDPSHYHWSNFEYSSDNINELEMNPVLLGLQRLGPSIVNQHEECNTDNNQVLSNINL